LPHVTFTSSASVEFCSIRGWPGTTPVSQALPWAFAWSTILYCPPYIGCPSWYSRDGRHLRHGQAVAERRTTCPSSDGTTRGQDGSCSKDRRACCSPWTTLMESPTTRGLAPARINSATRSYMTVPRSSLSLIRFAFRHRLPSHCYSTGPVFSRASHLAAGRVSDTLVKRGSDKVGSQVRQ
jgi:hypothetical protein